MPYGTFTYRVRAHKVVKSNDWSIIKGVGHEQLVLSACHPLYSASHRWVVFADLVSITLPGARRPRRSSRRARRTAPAAPAAQLALARLDQHEAAGRRGARDLVRRVGQRMDLPALEPGRAARACACPAAAPRAASGSVTGCRLGGAEQTSTSGAISRCSPTSADSGLPGQAEHDRAGRRTAGPDGLARLDRDAPEQLLDAERRERRLDVVARPDGHAAARDDEVGLERRGEQPLRLLQGVRHPAAVLDVAAERRQRAAEQQRVRVVHLAAPQRRAGRDQLVARWSARSRAAGGCSATAPSPAAASEDTATARQQRHRRRRRPRRRAMSAPRRRTPSPGATAVVGAHPSVDRARVPRRRRPRRRPRAPRRRSRSWPRCRARAAADHRRRQR